MRSPKGYLCKQCARVLGSRKFSNHELRMFRNKQDHALKCEECKGKYKCGACNKYFKKKYWSSQERKNTSRPSRRRPTALVCKTCRDKGYHAHDTNTYCCTTCDKKYGGKKFDYASLRNFKNCNRQKLLCKECSRLFKLENIRSKKRPSLCR